MSKRLPKGFCANLKAEDNRIVKSRSDLIPFDFSKEVLEGKKKIVATLATKNK